MARAGILPAGREPLVRFDVASPPPYSPKTLVNPHKSPDKRREMSRLEVDPAGHSYRKIRW